MSSCSGQACDRMPGLSAEASTTIQDNPTTIEDNPNWRRHKGACGHYRERWSGAEEVGDDGCRLLYQIVCLMGTPPLTAQEQDRCMGATRSCWRLRPSDDSAEAAPPRSARSRRGPGKSDRLASTRS